MKSYMLNICKGNPANSSHPEDDDFVMQKYNEWTESMGKAIESAHKLKDGFGSRVSLSKGQVVNGPYVESTESLGGYYIVKCASFEEAQKLAAQCPTVLYQGGFVEVREIEF